MILGDQKNHFPLLDQIHNVRVRVICYLIEVVDGLVERAVKMTFLIGQSAQLVSDRKFC